MYPVLPVLGASLLRGLIRGLVLLLAPALGLGAATRLLRHASGLVSHLG